MSLVANLQLEELKTEEVQNINEVEVLEGNAFDFDEPDHVEQGMITQAIVGEAGVINYISEGNGDGKRHRRC